MKDQPTEDKKIANKDLFFSKLIKENPSRALDLAKKCEQAKEAKNETK